LPVLTSIYQENDIQIKSTNPLALNEITDVLALSMKFNSYKLFLELTTVGHRQYVPHGCVNNISRPILLSNVNEIRLLTADQEYGS